MRRYPLLFLVVATLAVSLPAWSASLEEARQFHDNGETEKALAAIEDVLSSGADETEKAEALDLLGTIAVDKGQLAMAKQAWSRLADEYPDYAGSHDTATKLSLVSALLQADEAPSSTDIVSEKAVEDEADVPAVVREVEPEVPAAEPVPEVAPAAAPARPAPAPEASTPVTSKPTPSDPAAEPSGAVLVAARGKPHDAVRELSDRIVEFLRAEGVDAQSATGGIPVVEDSKMVLPMLLQKGQQDSAGSVLLLSADFVSMQKVALDCYTPAGAKLWKVKVSGGTGWKGRPYSKSGITEELAERFLEKLVEKIGEPGLPVTLK